MQVTSPHSKGNGTAGLVFACPTDIIVMGQKPHGPASPPGLETWCFPKPGDLGQVGQVVSLLCALASCLSD